eukprot:TRINITY_DN15207_c0_g1_i2.p1 TRINITY_DN15207_c0_g1~~TRINITY_DN15207_c0_g1_i2.p1  ORF type:complete len:379 (+),score=37.13 TRINITY_DN15207_c0_g1_i2:611-1747(+)
MLMVGPPPGEGDADATRWETRVLPQNLDSFEVLERVLREPGLTALSSTFRRQQPLVIEDEKGRLLRSSSRLAAQAGQTARVNGRRAVYVAQREYALAVRGGEDAVDFIGTDEMTTCMGIVLVEPTSGGVCVGHLDFPNSVVKDLQAMTGALRATEDQHIEVHIAGCFDDTEGAAREPLNPYAYVSEPLPSGYPGYSWDLAVAVFWWLYRSRLQFLLRSACILRHNTAYEGASRPIVCGIGVDMRAWRVCPMRFSPEMRGPALELRGTVLKAKSSACCPYHTATDTYRIGPYIYQDNEEETRWLLGLSDDDLLQQNSTSPWAESRDFVPNLRRQLQFYLDHPDSRMAFPNRKPKIFRRRADESSSGWILWEEAEDHSPL